MLADANRTTDYIRGPKYSTSTHPQTARESCMHRGRGLPTLDIKRRADAFDLCRRGAAGAVD